MRTLVVTRIFLQLGALDELTGATGAEDAGQALVLEPGAVLPASPGRSTLLLSCSAIWSDALSDLLSEPQPERAAAASAATTATPNDERKRAMARWYRDEKNEIKETLPENRRLNRLLILSFFILGGRTTSAYRIGGSGLNASRAATMRLHLQLITSVQFVETGRAPPVLLRSRVGSTIACCCGVHHNAAAHGTGSEEKTTP